MLPRRRAHQAVGAVHIGPTQVSLKIWWHPICSARRLVTCSLALPTHRGTLHRGASPACPSSDPQRLRHSALALAHRRVHPRTSHHLGSWQNIADNPAAPPSLERVASREGQVEPPKLTRSASSFIREMSRDFIDESAQLVAPPLDAVPPLLSRRHSFGRHSDLQPLLQGFSASPIPLKETPIPAYKAHITMALNQNDPEKAREVLGRLAAHHASTSTDVQEQEARIIKHCEQETQVGCDVCDTWYLCRDVGLSPAEAKQARLLHSNANASLVRTRTPHLSSGAISPSLPQLDTYICEACRDVTETLRPCALSRKRELSQAPRGDAEGSMAPPPPRARRHAHFQPVSCEYL